MEKRKRAVAVETIVWWIIAVAVLVIILVLAGILKGKLWEIGRYLRNLI